MTRSKYDRAGELFDLLAGAPDGMTIDEITADLKITQRYAEEVLRDLRLTLGHSDDLFVPCDRDDDGIYRYCLKSGAAIVNANPDNDKPSSQWTATRITDLESRLLLFIAAARSAETATDGRTTEGRKAALFLRYMLRLAEDLAEVEGRLFP